MQATMGLFRSRILPVLAAALAVSAQARTLRVGPGKTYAKPSAAAAAVQDGDTVLIDAGVYENDACYWEADNLVLKGTAKYAHLKSNGTTVGGKGIWVITGDNYLVENIEFSGAKVPDENGAGIRQEGSNITVRNCYFHDNENGFFGGGGSTSEVVIEFTELAYNGLGDGFTHNIYCDVPIKSFTLRHSYSHHAKIGHTVKSRAKKTLILYNRIMTEATGQSSYEINIPDAGEAYIIGNLIQQGPENDNPGMISYGEESHKNGNDQIYVINNTMVDDDGDVNRGNFVEVIGSGFPIKVINNLFVGGTSLKIGAGTAENNITGSKSDFVDAAKYDYRLKAGAIAIDKGKDPGSVAGFSLTPTFQYVHPVGKEARPQVGALDAGAYEYNPSGTTNGTLRPGHSRMKSKRPHLLLDGPGATGWLFQPERSTDDYNAIGKGISSSATAKSNPNIGR